MYRTGFVSNSSSSSFIVALRKGYTWEQIVEESGPMATFAEKLIDFIGKECEPLESIQNVELAWALKNEGGTPEETVEWVKEGEFAWVRKEYEKIVDDPENWLFGRGSASYNDTYDPIEIFFGYGGKIDSDMLKVTCES